MKHPGGRNSSSGKQRWSAGKIIKSGNVEVQPSKIILEITSDGHLTRDSKSIDELSIEELRALIADLVEVIYDVTDDRKELEKLLRGEKTA
jgi:hypothetical protein